MATYTVKKGDTLSAIAKQFGTTFQDIAKANGISDPNKIRVGQTLTIGEKATQPTASKGSSSATTETKAPSFEYNAYTPSDTVTQAQALLQQQLAQKPGEYQSAWGTQLNDMLQQILNREKFSYDLNGDMLYQQYKDQYTTQGKLAMMDTMGQAAAMTGGYGNSYAQTAGQQAYQGYLQQLNDKVPELYQLALNQYNAEGDEMYNQAALMAQQEEQDYGRWRDQVGDYYTELGRLTDDAHYQEEMDYGKWTDGRDFAYGQFVDGRNYDYQVGRDAVTDAQWQAQFDEAKRQWEKEYALSKSKSYSTPKKVADPEPTGEPLTDTENTKMFRASIMTSGEFAKRGKASVDGKTYTSYKSYVEACLEKWANNGIPNSNKTLTDDEVAFLMDQYGF